MNIFFTSDSHFGHSRIVQYDNRPYRTVQEMDEGLITNWNAVVQPNDFVWHLGDFSFRDTERYRRRLNGRIGIVWGNHDKETRRHKNLFEECHELKEININGTLIVLCHYSMQVWKNSHHGSWHLFGHSHGGLKGVGKSFDVGVNCNNYAPIPYDEVARRMSKLEAIGHHE